MFLWSYVTFPRPIVCVDFIFEVSSVIPPLPTEKKNFRWQQTWKSVFQEYLNIASTHEFSDCRFGIYAKSWVYMKFFTIMALFWWKLSADPVFAPKTGFCCSWTAKSGLRSTDHRFEKFRVESIYPQEESCFFLKRCETHPSPENKAPNNLELDPGRVYVSIVFDASIS